MSRPAAAIPLPGVFPTSTDQPMTKLIALADISVGDKDIKQGEAFEVAEPEIVHWLTSQGRAKYADSDPVTDEKPADPEPVAEEKPAKKSK